MSLYKDYIILAIPRCDSPVVYMLCIDMSLFI